MDVLSDYGFKEGPLFGYSAEKPEDYYKNYPDQIKVSPLILSVICGNSMVKTLLKLGASPSYPDENGKTPLMYAIQQVRRLSATGMIKTGLLMTLYFDIFIFPYQKVLAIF